MIRAVIFDMDGVVVESTSLDYKAWHETLKNHGIKISFDTYNSLLGTKSIDIIKKYIPDVTKAQAQKISEEKEGKFIELVKKEGVNSPLGLKKLIKKIKSKCVLFLATSAPKNKVDCVLQQLQLKDEFKFRVTAEDVKNGKPDTEVFLKAAAKVNIQPEKCIVIEDAVNGIKATKKAGMRCIAITTSFSKEKLQDADHIINNFNDFKMEWLQ